MYGMQGVDSTADRLEIFLQQLRKPSRAFEEVEEMQRQHHPMTPSLPSSSERTVKQYIDIVQQWVQLRKRETREVFSMYFTIMKVGNDHIIDE